MVEKQRYHNEGQNAPRNQMRNDVHGCDTSLAASYACLDQVSTPVGSRQNKEAGDLIGLLLGKMVNRATAWILGGLFLFLSGHALGWSNRGHRLINLIAAQSLPASLPAFMRTTEAQHEISYLGPEPDRWTQRGLEPELASTTGPDHFLRLELAETIGPLPRKRYEFLRKLHELQHQRPSDAPLLTPQYVGMLPWEAEEIWERLEAAFHVYRIAIGEFGPKDYKELVPIDRSDLSDIKASVLFYAGWLGHYIGDACMPLHASIHLAGWALRDDPNGYTRNADIHHRLEEVADEAIYDGDISAPQVQSSLSPLQRLRDPFIGELKYLKRESAYAEDVYRLQKSGELTANSPKSVRFIALRMAEGSSMLRDLIFSAWVESSSLTPPKRNAEVDAVHMPN